MRAISQHHRINQKASRCYDLPEVVVAALRAVIKSSRRLTIHGTAIEALVTQNYLQSLRSTLREHGLVNAFFAERVLWLEDNAHRFPCAYRLEHLLSDDFDRDRPVLPRRAVK